MSEKSVRFSVSVPQYLLRRFDEFLSELGLENRSRAVAEALLLYMSERSVLTGVGTCVGVLLLVYSHELSANEILEIQHRYLNLIQSSLHLHLSKELCLEVIAVRGEVSKVRKLVSELEKLRGVRILRCLLLREEDLRSW